MKKDDDTLLISHFFYSILGWFLFLIVFLVQYFIFLPLTILISIIFMDKDRKLVSYLSKIFCYIFFFLFLGHKIKINKNHLHPPQKGEKRIYVLTHASQYDVILMNLLPGPIKVIVKEKWVKKPLIGTLQKLGGNIVIKENTNRDETINTFSDAIDKLEKGIPIIIFPEGTRSKTGKMQKFYKGTFRLALETRADLVPVVMDTWNTIRPGGLWIRDIKPVIKILEPIQYDSYQHLSHIKLSQVVRSIMMEKLLKIRGERRQTEKNYYRNQPHFNEIDREMQQELVELKSELTRKQVSLNTNSSS